MLLSIIASLDLKGAIYMGIYSRLTRYVKILIVANVAVFFIDFLIDGNLDPLLGLQPHAAIYQLKIWQFFTYMFVHSVHDPMHLIFNMFMLWMFGGPVEEAMGGRKFIMYYLLCGLGAAVCACLFYMDTMTIGASGAIFGLIVAFGIFYPDSIVYVMFVFPMKGRNFAILFACLEFFFTLTARNDPVAHFAHIGGLVTGFFYLKYYCRKEDAPAKCEDFAQAAVTHRHEHHKSEASEKHDNYSQEKVDVILDKIRESGIESLSRDEYDTLQSASKLLRERDEKVVDLKEYRDKLR